MKLEKYLVKCVKCSWYLTKLSYSCIIIASPPLPSHTTQLPLIHRPVVHFPFLIEVPCGLNTAPLTRSLNLIFPCPVRGLDFAGVAPCSSTSHFGSHHLPKALREKQSHSWSTAAQPASQTTLTLRRIFFSLLSQKSMWNWTWSRNLPFLLNMQGNREVFNRLWRICSYSPSHWANITFLTTDSWTPTLATWPLFSILLQWILSILLCETLGMWSTRHYPHQLTFKGYEDGRFLNHRIVVLACVSEQVNASLQECFPLLGKWMTFQGCWIEEW